MARMEVGEAEVRIRLTAFERIAGLLRDRSVSLAAIADVGVEADPLRATEGLRAPGLGVPGSRKIGTWRGGGRRQMVCVRAGRPAVRIDARQGPYDRYLIGADDAAGIVERIRTAAAGGA